MNKFFLKVVALFGITLTSSVLICANAAVNFSQPKRLDSTSFLFVPDFYGGFGFSLGGLYLKPNSGYLDYAVFTKPFPILQPDWHVKSIDPNFSAASDIAIFYNFRHTGNQLLMRWLHLDTSDSDETVAEGTNFVAPAFQAGPAGGFFTRASGTNKFYFDTVQLNVSQFVDVVRRLHLHFFAGADFARIKQSLTVFYENAGPTVGFTTDNLSNFVGFGPDAGVGGEFDACHGFGIVGEMRGMLLVGHMQSQDTFNLFNPTIQAAGTSPINQSIHSDETVPVVPGMDSKLGFVYKHSMGSHASFSIEFGYKFAVYVDAIHQVYPTALVTAIATTTAAVSTLTKIAYNFSVNGPYLTLSFYEL